MNTDFWAHKKVLVTGHTGFKGSWMTYWLHQMGAQVTGFALAPQTNPNLFTVLELEGRCRHLLGDVRDQQQVAAALEQSQAEVVIHMAAQSLVRPSYADPVGTYATNVMGTVHLLEAVRKTPSVRSVVVVTSDKCYENSEWEFPYRENDPLGGHDPYSSSKGCAELVTAAYRKSYFSPATHAQHGVCISSARAGNVIGGGDWSEDRLLVDAAKAFASGTELVLRSPQAVRPWQHVLEPVRGYLTLAEAGVTRGTEVARAFNFGPSEQDCVSVEEVIRSFGQAWGMKSQFKVSHTTSPLHEAKFLRLESSCAQRLLRWRPRWNLAEALTHTAQWYRLYYERASRTHLETLMHRQIQQGLGG